MNPGSQGNSGARTAVKGDIMKTSEVAWFIDTLHTNCIFLFVKA